MEPDNYTLNPIDIVEDVIYSKKWTFSRADDCELVAEIAIAKKLEATYDEMLSIIHPHPTISETIKEAALATEKQAIHI